MHETLINFLKEQTCATICCKDDAGNPYCFNCYYLFGKDNALLYFKTSKDSNHYLFLQNNPIIGGTILPDKLSKLVVKGVQLQGEILEQEHPLAKDASTLYHKKYPMGLAIKGEVFTVQIQTMKMTDSSLGFGKKISWSQEVPAMESTSTK